MYNQAMSQAMGLMVPAAENAGMAGTIASQNSLSGLLGGVGMVGNLLGMGIGGGQTLGGGLLSGIGSLFG